MKLAIICRPFSFHGGVETATAGLIGELRRRGHAIPGRRGRLRLDGLGGHDQGALDAGAVQGGAGGHVDEIAGEGVTYYQFIVPLERSGEALQPHLSQQEQLRQEEREKKEQQERQEQAQARQ